MRDYGTRTRSEIFSFLRPGGNAFRVLAGRGCLPLQPEDDHEEKVMFLNSWRRRFLRESKRNRQSKRPLSRPQRFQPALEFLEDRLAPAVFNVNTTADTVAANLNTGQDNTGHVSLRAAVQAANHLGGTNSINLPAWTYQSAIPGAGEDNAATGDLD